MGLKVNDGSWKTVTAPAKYSTDGGVTWYEARKTNFLDPVTGNYMKGVWGDVPPNTIVSPDFSYSWNGTAYIVTATWAQIVDTDGDFATLEVEKVVTAGATTASSVAYSSLTHPASVTTFVFGAAGSVGYTELTFRFRIVDATGQAGAWASTPARRVPPSPPVSAAIANQYVGPNYVGRVTWIAPTGTISSYRIVWTRNGAGGGTINGATSPTDLTTSVVGGDLLAATLYAIDPAGTLSPGIALSLRTPPNIPTSVALANMNTATATLSWAAPATGAFTGYRYRYSTNSGATFTSWVTVSTAVTSASISIVGVNKLLAQIEAINSPSTPQTTSQTVSTADTFVLPPTPVSDPAQIVGNTAISVDYSDSSLVNVQTFTFQIALNGGAYVTYSTAGTGGGGGDYIELRRIFSKTALAIANNTAQGVRIIATHANGQTATLTLSVTSASTIAAPVAKFLAGAPSGTWTHLTGNSNYDISVTKVSTGETIEYVTVGAVATWTSAQPSLYEEMEKYRLFITPKRTNATAALVISTTDVRKLPNPIQIDTTESDTYRSGVWRGIGSVYQGYTASGLNYGCYLYGNQFHDALHADANGYTPTINDATLFLFRDGAGINSQRAPRLWLHNLAAKADGSPVASFNGGVDLGTLAYNESANEDFDTYSILHWIGLLRDQTGGAKGLGLFHPSTTIVGGVGTSNEYMKFSEGGFFYLFQGTSGRVTIHHDG